MCPTRFSSEASGTDDELSPAATLLRPVPRVRCGRETDRIVEIIVDLLQIGG
jgi:hypothetical protein